MMLPHLMLLVLPRLLLHVLPSGSYTLILGSGLLVCASRDPLTPAARLCPTRPAPPRPEHTCLTGGLHSHASLTCLSNVLFFPSCSVCFLLLSRRIDASPRHFSCRVCRLGHSLCDCLILYLSFMRCIVFLSLHSPRSYPYCFFNAFTCLCADNIGVRSLHPTPQDRYTFA